VQLLVEAVWELSAVDEQAVLLAAHILLDMPVVEAVVLVAAAAVAEQVVILLLAGLHKHLELVRGQHLREVVVVAVTLDRVLLMAVAAVA